QRRFAAGHAIAVARVRGLERVELRDQTAHVAQLGELLGEDLIDAGGSRLAAQRAQTLRPGARRVRLPPRRDQGSGAQDGILLVLGPGGVQGCPPALEGTKDVQPFEDVVASDRFHPYLIARAEVTWEAVCRRGRAPYGAAVSAPVCAAS